MRTHPHISLILKTVGWTLFHTNIFLHLFFFKNVVYQTDLPFILLTGSLLFFAADRALQAKRVGKSLTPVVPYLYWGLVCLGMINMSLLIAKQYSGNWIW